VGDFSRARDVTSRVLKSQCGLDRRKKVCQWKAGSEEAGDEEVDGTEADGTEADGTEADQK
jgi:hypothetical protein